jgi:hypothetical protein
MYPVIQAIPTFGTILVLPSQAGYKPADAKYLSQPDGNDDLDS